MRGRPLDLLPSNPRFLRFRGEPTFLLTSAEHYGAVFNLDFNYRRYLDHLQRHRFNYTRTASGTFVELKETIEGSGWENSQAPRPGRYIGPWARSDEPGYAYGGPKFDLDRWDEAYWERLRDFVIQAGLRGVIVELTLFTAMYTETHWSISPMKASNNVNGVGAVECQQVYRPDNDGLWDYQEKLVRRFARELSEFDNVFIELVNEPYFASIDDTWLDRVVRTLQDEFASAGRSLLLAWNLANFHERADTVHPGISIVNFHYANPPTAVAMNHDLAKPSVYDETGYIGVADEPYRIHAWQFMLAGGSGFNHLDYSYAPSGQEDGSRVLPANASGGGSETLRDQYTALRDFLAALPFAAMAPDTDFVVTELDDPAQLFGIAQAGEAYAAHLLDVTEKSLQLTVEPGYYEVRWLDPITGADLASPGLVATTGTVHLDVPARHRELAVSLRRHRLDTGDGGGNLFDFAGVASND